MLEQIMFVFVILKPQIDSMTNVCILRHNIWLCAIGFALVYYVGVNERENPKSGMELFQSNIYCYVRIKEYFVPAQDSCACTRFLCMHNTPGAAVFVCWVPALVPGPSSACTRVMHNIPFYSYILINIALKHFHTRLGIFSFIYTYTVD